MLREVMIAVAVGLLVGAGLHSVLPTAAGYWGLGITALLAIAMVVMHNSNMKRLDSQPDGPLIGGDDRHPGYSGKQLGMFGTWMFTIMGVLVCIGLACASIVVIIWQ